MNIFDISKYKTPLYKLEDLETLGSQVAQAKVPSGDGWITVIFLFLKCSAMAAIYGIWSKQRDDQMAVDKQKFEQGLVQTIHTGDNIL